MKNILIALLLLTSISAFGHGGGGFKDSDIFKTMGANDKIAILMVHFGTITRRHPYPDHRSHQQESGKGIPRHRSTGSLHLPHDYAPFERKRHREIKSRGGNEQTHRRRVHASDYPTHEYHRGHRDGSPARRSCPLPKQIQRYSFRQRPALHSR